MPSRTISGIAVIATSLVAIATAALGFFQSLDWPTIGKTWGPLGVFSVVFILLLFGGAKVARTLLTETISDARKERDAQRQLLKEQATEFVAALRFRDEKFRDVVEALDRIARDKR